jgi:hypothetical protein
MTLAWLNRCAFKPVAYSDTDDFEVNGSAPVTGFYAPADCLHPAVVDTATYHYFARSADKTQHEEGDAVWDEASGKLLRLAGTVRNSSNSGALVSFSAAPIVTMGGSTAADMGVAFYSTSEEITTVAGHFDFTVNNIAERASYDGEATGFGVIVFPNVADSLASYTLYTKVSDASGDWSAGTTLPSINPNVFTTYVTSAGSGELEWLGIPNQVDVDGAVINADVINGLTHQVILKTQTNPADQIAVFNGNGVVQLQVHGGFNLTAPNTYLEFFANGNPVTQWYPTQGTNPNTSPTPDGTWPVVTAISADGTIAPLGKAEYGDYYQTSEQSSFGGNNDNIYRIELTSDGSGGSNNFDLNLPSVATPTKPLYVVFQTQTDPGDFITFGNYENISFPNVGAGASFVQDQSGGWLLWGLSGGATNVGFDVRRTLQMSPSGELVWAADTKRAGNLSLNMAGFNIHDSIDVSGDPVVKLISVGFNLLTSLNVSNCTALFSLNADSNDSFSDIDVSGCTALHDLSATSNQIAVIDLSTCPALVSVFLSTNQLMSLDVSNCVTLSELDVSANALTESAVDAILAALDSNGLSDGTVDLSGGTNAPPSAAGLTSKSNLEGKGWSVSVSE